MKPSLIVDVVVRVVFHSALVLAVYLLFAGHNQPGGGFVGGLVAASAFALRYVAGGIDAVRAGLRVPAWALLGTGLLLMLVTAAVPLVVGGALLESGYATVALGPLGSPKVTSATPFDAGVFLVVVGMVLMVFEGVGESSEEEDS